MEAAKIEKRNVQCPPGRLKLMEVAHNLWSVHAPEGVTPEDVEKSEFWSLMTTRLRPYDQFEVLSDDGAWRVHGTIVSCGRTWAQVFIERIVKFGTQVEPERSDKHEVKWKGPEKLWCLIRLKDGAIIQEKIETKEAANAFLAEHEKKVK